MNEDVFSVEHVDILYRYSLERWGQDLQSLDRWVRPAHWIELGSPGLVPWRVMVVHQWEIWSNEPSDTYLDIASRCLWWYVSCRMLPPCSQGDDKADVWWVWGNLVECNFCICLSFQHAQKEPTLQFESLTSFEALLETVIPNSIKRNHQLRMLEGLQLLRESGFDRALAWCLNVSQGARLSWRYPRLPFTSLSFSNTFPVSARMEQFASQQLKCFGGCIVSTDLSVLYGSCIHGIVYSLCFILRGYSSAYQQLFIPILKHLFCVFVHLFCLSYLFWGAQLPSDPFISYLPS